MARYRRERQRSDMKRRDVIALIARLRRARDRCDRTGMHERGMRDGFHLSAHWLWRDLNA